MTIVFQFQHLVDIGFSEVQVGLQLQSYTVSEESTNVRVCVQVLYPPSNCSIGFPFSLLLNTSDVTAG